jgi:Flp pilus assembly protein TadG
MADGAITGCGLPNAGHGALPTRARFLDRDWFAGFGRAEKGATAVEFAMVALPLVMFLAGILELGMLFLMCASLENSTNNISRSIRTGTLQAGSSASDFKTSICNNLGWAQANCMSNLSVDVRTYNQFSDITLTTPITNGAIDPSLLQFQTGTPGSIVVVRAYYAWTLFFPNINSGLVRLGNGKALLVATTAFRNEPSH